MLYLNSISIKAEKKTELKTHIKMKELQEITTYRWCLKQNILLKNVYVFFRAIYSFINKFIHGCIHSSNSMNMNWTSITCQAQCGVMGPPKWTKHNPSLLQIVCVPQIHMLKSNPPSDSIWKWGLWGVNRSWGWSLLNEISAVIKETAGSSLAPPCDHTVRRQLTTN